MRRLLLLTVIFSMYATAAHAAPLVREGTASFGAGLQTTVDQFRADLGGPLQPNNGQTFENGRREINWDGVPDPFSSPNALPPDFFNKNSPRGVVLTTPGSGFQTSATAASGVPVRFGNINPAYPGTFLNFSPQRLFTPIGSTVTETDFFVPGKTDRLGVKGFGAVFSDVDQAGSARIEFFDADGNLLLDRAAPASPGTTLSFLGATFDGETPLHHVRITSGTAPLAAGTTDGGGTDVVALDDFIYGEPHDADGVGTDDNCPGVANSDQKDTDGDKKGDACDTDDDNDGVLDTDDAFPHDAAETTDLDRDGIGDNRDADLDGDGVSNGDESTRGTDPRKADTDGDGAGDRTDNCLIVSNAGQADGDADGRGDACDSPTVTKLAVKRAKKGFKVSYGLSEPASLRFTVEKKTKTGAFKRLKGQFLKQGKAGANAFAFSGKLNRKPLGAGTYRLVAEATDSANEKSAVVRKGFTVLRKRR